MSSIIPPPPHTATYTFTVRLPLSHLGAEAIVAPQHPRTTPQHLAEVVRSAFERMAMQSDLRDLYQSVRLVAFGAANASKNGMENSGSNEGEDDGEAVVADLAMQLSENDDQRHLLAVFRDYLRASNYSVGGTDLFAMDDGRMDVYGMIVNIYFNYN